MLGAKLQHTFSKFITAIKIVIESTYNMFKFSSAETGIFQINLVNIKTANAFDRCVTRPSVMVVLTM